MAKRSTTDHGRKLLLGDRESKRISKLGLNQRSLGGKLFVGGWMEREEGVRSCNMKRKGENQVKAGFSSDVIPRLLSE